MVRVRCLLRSPESYDSWRRNRRAPRVGDIGAIVEVLHAPGALDRYVVEASGPDGVPVWLGDFQAYELAEVEADPAPDDRPRREEFERLAAEWRSRAEFLSSPTKISELPAYRAIVDMGPDAVPLILEELRREPDHGFVALKRITGEDPVPEEDRGDLDRMARAWLEWGRNHGIDG